jgi:hypothetical protein
MRGFGNNKFVPASLLTTVFVGRTVYNLLWNPDSAVMVPMSRRTLLREEHNEIIYDSPVATFKLEQMKNEYEAKLAEQSRLHEAQIAKLLLTTKQQQQKIRDNASSAVVGGGGESLHLLQKKIRTIGLYHSAQRPIISYPFTRIH